MTSLSEVLQTARAYWDAKGPSSRMMPIRAERCGDLLEPYPGALARIEAPSIDAADATLLLTRLAQMGLSRSSQGAYYSAFRRALALSGISTANWPKPPTKPRRVREPIHSTSLQGIIEHLMANDEPETAHLARAIMATGMRVDVEALRIGAVEAKGEDMLKVVGKGGHERLIPVASSQVILGALREARRLCYSTHIKRWRLAVKALGVQSRLPTFHAIRHLYASEAYKRSGNNLHVVKELLGHSSVDTTAGYIGVDMAAMREAVGG